MLDLSLQRLERLSRHPAPISRPVNLGTRAGPNRLPLVRAFAFIGAAATLAIAVLLATVVIQDGDPMCPPDAFGTPESNYSLCYRPIDPTDAPSDIEVIPVSIDQKTSERAMVIGVGVIGALFLLGLGLRITSVRRNGGDTED